MEIVSSSSNSLPGKSLLSNTLDILQENDVMSAYHSNENGINWGCAKSHRHK